jgi:hypothetical protein
MNRYSLTLISTLFLLVATLSSCEAIGTIFKAGVWSGIIIVALILGIIIYFVSRGRK